MKILHSGFDSIYFAVKGALSPEAETHLSNAKEQAVEKQCETLFKTIDESAQYHIQQSGKQGGYAYAVDTGFVGSNIGLKKNLNRNEWNGFVEIKSASLLTKGWEAAMKCALDQLKSLGFYIAEISLNRVDYCVDFLNADLELNPAHFVAHSKVKKFCYYADGTKTLEVDKVSVSQSDTIKSIRLGMMPNKQVTVYDKRAEVIENRKTYWFKAWGVDPKDTSVNIYRVEIRAGKKELLKNHIKSLEEFEASIGTVLISAASALKYVVPSPNDSNISRAPLHPIWVALNERLASAMQHYSAPITAPVICKHMQETKAHEYKKQIIGNLGGLFGCLGISADDLSDSAEEALLGEIASAQDDSQHPIWKSYHRNRDIWDSAQ